MNGRQKKGDTEKCNQRKTNESGYETKKYEKIKITMEN